MQNVLQKHSMTIDKNATKDRNNEGTALLCLMSVMNDVLVVDEWHYNIRIESGSCNSKQSLADIRDLRNAKTE